jgi:hypothetical protein
VITIFVPKELRGTHSRKVYSNAKLQSDIENIDIDFKHLIENFYGYKIDEKWILSFKTTVSEITKTRLFDVHGEPIYIIRTASILKFKQKW